MAKKITYKEAVSELESILEALESNQLEMDELTTKAKRATELIKFCQERIYQTSEEIEKILKEKES